MNYSGSCAFCKRNDHALCNGFWVFVPNKTCKCTICNPLQLEDNPEVETIKPNKQLSLFEE